MEPQASRLNNLGAQALLGRSAAATNAQSALSTSLVGELEAAVTHVARSGQLETPVDQHAVPAARRGQRPLYTGLRTQITTTMARAEERLSAPAAHGHR